LSLLIGDCQFSNRWTSGGRTNVVRAADPCTRRQLVLALTNKHGPGLSVALFAEVQARSTDRINEGYVSFPARPSPSCPTSCQGHRRQCLARSHSGLPTVAAPALCASPWLTADGAGTGAVCIPQIDFWRCRHQRPVRPDCGRL